MSKYHFGPGISLNTNHDGLLSVSEDCLNSLIKNEPIAKYYHVEQTPFARGKFAAVRKCTHRVTGVEYAAKFIRKRRRSMDQRQEILHEVAVLRLAERSARIVRLHEVYETPQEIAIVLELAAGGELQRVVDIQDGIVEAEAIQLMRQILEGLIFLHDHNIAHLDLKPQNMLLTSSYPDCDIKLCDFGISRVIQTGIEVREILGTPDYVAPEVLSYEPISLATDIWSVGVLSYVLLSGYSPFAGDTKQETFCNISQCLLSFPDDLFEGVSEAAKDFIHTTLQTDPSCRLTARQCLEHPWLNGKSPLLDCVSSPILNGCPSDFQVRENGNEDSPTEQKEAHNDLEEASPNSIGNSSSSSSISSGGVSHSASPSPSPIHTLSRTSSICSRTHPTVNGRRSSYPLVTCCLNCTSAIHSNTNSPANGTNNNSSTAASITNNGHELSHMPGHLPLHKLSPLPLSSPVEITVDRGIIC